jgi:hypothetical protein
MSIALRCLASGLLAAVLTATPVAAQQFQAFSSICLDTSARRDAADEILTQQNWYKDRGRIQQADSRNFLDTQYYANVPAGTAENAVPNPMLVMLAHAASEQVFGLEGSHIETCTVWSRASTVEALAANVTERLGFSPVRSGEMLIWPFTLSNGVVGDRTGDSEAEFLQLLRSHEVQIVSLSSTGGSATLMLDVSRPNR